VLERNKLEMGDNEEAKKDQFKGERYHDTNYVPFNTVNPEDIETTNNGLNSKILDNSHSLNFETDHIL
jgi:hypothetical protein